MKVLVTRPEPDNQRTAEALKARGHQPLLIRLIDILPLAASLPAIKADCLVATSAHAFAHLPGTMAKNARKLPVWTVGERTAAAARAAGFRNIRIGPGDAAGLAEAMVAALPLGTSIAYLAGQPRKSFLEERLKAAGFHLQTVPLYKAVPLTMPPPELIAALQGPDLAVLHFSRASAEAFAQLCSGETLKNAAQQALHVCLSADVAEGLAQVAPFRNRIAQNPHEASLLNALDDTFADDDHRMTR
jgi:uroporphyrinogen-III synthase